MKDLFLKDSVLKIISFVIALLLWFYIIAVIDPSVDITVRDIPIRYTNEALIESKGLCLVSDEKTTVELKVRGSRKRIANIDNKNIYATVDLANITKTGTFSLPISISIPYEYDEIIGKNPYNASVFIDKVISAQREVKVHTSGNAANGYIAGVPTPSVATVSLKGPSTLIDTISSVGAELNFAERSADIKDTEELFFVNSEGKRIPDDNKIYDLVTMNIESIDIECPVYKLKTVPVKVNAKASSPISEYKISVQPANITVYAENDILQTVNELSTELVNLDEITKEPKTLEVKLPEGIFLRDGVNVVTVRAEKRD